MRQHAIDGSDLHITKSEVIVGSDGEEIRAFGQVCLEQDADVDSIGGRESGCRVNFRSQLRHLSLSPVDSEDRNGSVRKTLDVGTPRCTSPQCKVVADSYLLEQLLPRLKPGPGSTNRCRLCVVNPRVILSTPALQRASDVA